MRDDIFIDPRAKARLIRVDKTDIVLNRDGTWSKIVDGLDKHGNRHYIIDSYSWAALEAANSGRH